MDRRSARLPLAFSQFQPEKRNPRIAVDRDTATTYCTTNSTAADQASHPHGEQRHCTSTLAHHLHEDPSFATICLRPRSPEHQQFGRADREERGDNKNTLLREDGPDAKAFVEANPTISTGRIMVHEPARNRRLTGRFRCRLAHSIFKQMLVAGSFQHEAFAARQPDQQSGHARDQ